MPEIKGFHGLHFNTDKLSNLDHAITPPYDVISPDERQRLADQDPHSMVHLILPEEKDGKSRYEVARDNLKAWREEDALVQDDKPSYYLLRQHFTDLDGNARVRSGFFAVTRLPEADDNKILGHERTFDKPVEDRLLLTAAAKANFGAVFVLYSDREQALKDFLGQMDRRPADITANTIDGVTQELWRVDEDPAVAAFIEPQTLYIADGHHRFKTACAHRDQMRAEGQGDENSLWNYCLMGFVAFEDDGLSIYPPHRLVDAPDEFNADEFVQSLQTWFDVTPVADGLPERVAQANGQRCSMGVAIHGKGDYLLALKDIDRTALLGDDRAAAWRDLDVAVLHRGILERIIGLSESAVHRYEKNVDQAMACVRSGDCDLAFILQATRAEQIRACADAGEPMPQKSTYFFPKLPTGGVFYAFD